MRRPRLDHRRSAAVRAASAAWRQEAECYPDRRCAASEVGAKCTCSQDRQQCVDGAERDASNGRGMGRNRTRSMRDQLLRTTKNAASFHDFDDYERLLESVGSDRQAKLVVLLGGEAGLRCGEIMALEWSDVDLNRRQLCVARSGSIRHSRGERGRPPHVRAVATVSGRRG